MYIDIEQVKQIVVAAGNQALAAQNGQIAVETKADMSLVTAVDRDTELFLERELSAVLPGIPIVGEEFGRRGPESDSLWVVDPIDGTTNFVWGLPHWCVSVGFLNDGIPELGVIYAPVLRELFWAKRGEGAWLNGNRITAMDCGEPGVEDTICLTSNVLKSVNTEVIPGRLRCLGSIALELAYTAAGRLKATVGLREGIVDIGAALCICFEAGCGFHYLTGDEVDIKSLIFSMRTNRHFVYGPPLTSQWLCDSLKVR